LRDEGRKYLEGPEREEERKRTENNTEVEAEMGEEGWSEDVRGLVDDILGDKEFVRDVARKKCKK